MPSSNTLPILSVHNLSTGYGKKQVLFDVKLDVMPGEVVLITGGNGSGKSTLLKAIYGLLPTWNDDTEILFRPDQNGAAIRTSIATNNLAQGLAYLPQKNAVFDDLTVEDNLRLAGHILRDGKEFARRREEVLSNLPKLSALLRQKPDKMSGGERQMTALAMALLHRPKLLLLDEPLAGLGGEAVVSMLDSFSRLKIESDTTLVLVEHRMHELLHLASRVIRFRLGSVIFDQSAH